LKWIASFAVSRVHEVEIDIETLRRDFYIAAIADLVFMTRERAVFTNCTEDRKAEDRKAEDRKVTALFIHAGSFRTK